MVEWDADAEESLVYVGGKGRGTMELLPGSSNFTLKPGTKDYGDPNRLAYFSCSGPTIAVPVQQADPQRLRRTQLTATAGPRRRIPARSSSGRARCRYGSRIFSREMFVCHHDRCEA